MPEAITVFVVFLVAGGVYVGVSLHTRKLANHNPSVELERLRGHQAWLERRLEIAQREKWSGEMVARIADELAVTSRKLAAVGSAGI